MSLHILDEKGIPIDRQVFTWRDFGGKPYSKLDDDAFTRARVILMAGIEGESVRFSHACARMNGELRIPVRDARGLRSPLPVRGADGPADRDGREQHPAVVHRRDPGPPHGRMRTIERRDPEALLPETLPDPVPFQSQRRFIRETLANEQHLRARGTRIVQPDQESAASITYRAQLSSEGSPSEIVSADYQYTPGTELGRAASTAIH